MRWMSRSSIIIVWLAMLSICDSRSTLAAAPAKAPAALVEAIAASRDPRISAVIRRIDGTGRQLLALRAYLRAGDDLTTRWSWTADQIMAFRNSPEDLAMQKEIERVRMAFATANPGFTLWINPEVRSLDTQLANWNSNASVSRAAADLQEKFNAWLDSAAIATLSSAELQKAATKFLTDVTPAPIPTLAAPGLSPHGQMRAVDFQIRKGDRTVAGPESATIASRWDDAGWAQKLEAAVHAGSRSFSGPLASPREPWHYTYEPAP